MLIVCMGAIYLYIDDAYGCYIHLCWWCISVLCTCILMVYMGAIYMYFESVYWFYINVY